MGSVLTFGKEHIDSYLLFRIRSLYLVLTSKWMI
jgi:hypothetical protein